MSRFPAMALLTLLLLSAAALGYAQGVSAAQSTEQLKPEDFRFNPQQQQQQRPSDRTPFEPKLFTGDDIGFMVTKPDSSEGILVIRIDGAWVQAKNAGQVVLLKTRH